MLPELLQALTPSVYADLEKLHPEQIGKHIVCHSAELPDWTSLDIALVGIKDDRGNTRNPGAADAPDKVREALYRLYKGSYALKIGDLGDIRPGSSLMDTYTAVAEVTGELIKNKVVPILIGGSHDLTYGQYLAYKPLNILANMVNIDETIDIGEEDTAVNADNFLYHIFAHQPNYLFDYSHIGYQSYLVSDKAILALDKLRFDCHRLGKVRQMMEEVEPVVRDAHLLSFDIGSIRQSDAPGHAEASPNGFYGEEACQITRYAGMSDKLTSIGFYEMNPVYDNNQQTMKLVAQMIWYFIDGYYNRKHDYPILHEKEYLKYIIDFDDNDYELVFCKSRKSDRWWIEVPQFKNGEVKNRHYVPCSYQDYQQASQGEVPEKWLRAYEKLN